MKIDFLSEYKDKIVLISGSSGQIGGFMVEFFINLGCFVYGIDEKKSKFKSKKFIFIKCNISNSKNIEKIVKKIYKRHKKIDVVINNAAVSYKSYLTKRTKIELLNSQSVNLIAPINLTKCIAKNHKKKYSCKIINIGSVYGVRSPDFKIYDNLKKVNSEIYGGTKAGLIQITKYFAVALAKQNIYVNCISPGGLINQKSQSKKFIKNYISKVPLGRMCIENDLQMALIYFSNDKTNYTTGQNLIIDGGFTSC